MAISYIDKSPSVKAENGLFLVTAKSGEEQVQLILTRHALFGLKAKCAKAEAEAAYEELGFVPTPFQRRKMAQEAGEG